MYFKAAKVESICINISLAGHMGKSVNADWLDWILNCILQGCFRNLFFFFNISKAFLLYCLRKWHTPANNINIFIIQSFLFRFFFFFPNFLKFRLFFLSVPHLFLRMFLDERLIDISQMNISLADVWPKRTFIYL